VDNIDVYAQTTWAVNPDWSLTGGVRSTSVNFRVQDYFIRPGTANGDDGRDGSYLGHQFGPGHHAEHLGDALNIYANWGRGFKKPRASPNWPTGRARAA
jgi:iron complex outermembrane receptor protein